MRVQHTATQWAEVGLALWHITYKTNANGNARLNEACLGRSHDDQFATRNAADGAGPVLSLDAAGNGPRLHGDDRKPAIWLDPVRRSDRRQVSLGPRRDPARLHPVRGNGNLARSGRSVVRRQIWPQRRRQVWRGDDHACLGPELLRQFAAAAL